MFLLLLTALGTIVGYAIGSTIQWAVRKIPPVRRWRTPRWLVVVLIAVFWIPALAFTPIAIGWQLEQQAALDMPEPLPGSLILSLATLVIAALMLLLGRSIRAGSNALARLLGRWIRISRLWLRLATAVALVVARRRRHQRRAVVARVDVRRDQRRHQRAEPDRPRASTAAAPTAWLRGTRSDARAASTSATR